MEASIKSGFDWLLMKKRRPAPGFSMQEILLDRFVKEAAESVYRCFGEG
jgi:hypothetical protein